MMSSPHTTIASENDIYDICIVGAGIGGLASALTLQREGFKVIVFERDGNSEDRRQGYGMTLNNSLSGPLAKLGLLEECIKNNCPSHCHYIFNPQGNVLGYYGRAFRDQSTTTSVDFEQQGGNRGNLRIPRQQLRAMLKDTLSPDTINWGYKFNHYSEEENCVTIQFERAAIINRNENKTVSSAKQMDHMDTDNKNIRVIRARVLVGADGMRSAVREQYKPSPPLNYLGVAVILGISSIKHPLLRDQGFYVLNGQHRLFTMPYFSSHINKNNTDNNEEDAPLIMWQLSFSNISEEETCLLRTSSTDNILLKALEMTTGWFPPVQELIQRTSVADVWATPLYDRDPLPQSSRERGGRVTVLGDASHPMSMFKGQGANQALEDAPLLATCLLGSHNQPRRNGVVGKKRRNQDGDIDVSVNDDKDIVNDKDHNATSAAIEKFRTLSRLDIGCRLRAFERQMTARAEKKVLGSRSSAAFLHSPQVFEGTIFHTTVTSTGEQTMISNSVSSEHPVLSISGLDTVLTNVVLDKLQQQKITAWEFSSLEDRMRDVIDEAKRDRVRIDKEG